MLVINIIITIIVFLLLLLIIIIIIIRARGRATRAGAETRGGSRGYQVSAQMERRIPDRRRVNPNHYKKPMYLD